MYFSKRSRAGQAARHQEYMMNMRQGVRLSYAQQSVQNIPHSFFRSMSFHSTNKTSTHSISPSHLPQNTQRGLSLSPLISKHYQDQPLPLSIYPAFWVVSATTLFLSRPKNCITRFIQHIPPSFPE